MGDRSETSMSDATVHTDCTSLNSNDDTQSSIDSIVIDLSHIPETPSTRKSVTFFAEPTFKGDFPSPFLSGKQPLAATYEPSEGGTFDEQKMVDVTGGGSRTASEMEGGGDLHPLIPGHRQSIVHRPSVVSQDVMIRARNTHYMKVWAITLIIFISLFAGGLFFWPLSTTPPLLPLIQTQIFPPLNSSDPTLHVNRTSREIRITLQGIRNEDFVSMRYTQSFSFIANESWPLPFTQARKCSALIDKDVICCRIMQLRECYIKEGNEEYRTYNVEQGEVIDIETFQGRVLLLKLNRLRDELFVTNGKTHNENYTRRLRIPAPVGHELTRAYLQNGTIFTVFEDKVKCKQMICQEKYCLPVRDPKCGLMTVYPALPSNSLVLLHCDTEGDRREGLHKHSLCTLSQLILPSLATIARSVPFLYTKGYNEDNHFVAFADYVDTTVFHVNQLRLSEKGQWEPIISTYRLLSLT